MLNIISSLAMLVCTGDMTPDAARADAFQIGGDEAVSSLTGRITFMENLYVRADKQIRTSRQIADTAAQLLRAAADPALIQTVASNINDGVLHADTVRSILRSEYRKHKQNG